MITVLALDVDDVLCSECLLCITHSKPRHTYSSAYTIAVDNTARYQSASLAR
jgi:hypothetical protein